MDLRMRMDWRRGGSIISYGAWGTIEEEGALGVPESKVSVPAEWSVPIGRVQCKGNGVRTREEVFEVLGNWDDKLLESSENWSIQIKLDLVKPWVVKE